MELETNCNHIIALFNKMCLFMQYSCTDICVTIDRPPVITHHVIPYQLKYFLYKHKLQYQFKATAFVFNKPFSPQIKH